MDPLNQECAAAALLHPRRLCGQAIHNAPTHIPSDDGSPIITYD